MDKTTLQNIISDLDAGRTPVLPIEEFPCFSPAALEGNEHVDPTYLQVIAESLTAADIPVFERALRAMDEGDLAWIGFKVVCDAAEACRNTDNEVTKKYGDVGSADGEPLVFFCNDAKEIVASRAYSDRDKFQMKDATRGPSMHNEQFEGLTWLSVPLFDAVRVWLLGASDAASEVAALAAHVGFEVTAVDYDPAYLNEGRFPDARRILLEGGNFDGLADLACAPEDYVCVLTRGHMFDPEGCVWATRHGAHYVGMMGCKGKTTPCTTSCSPRARPSRTGSVSSARSASSSAPRRPPSSRSPSSPNWSTCATASATAPRRAPNTRRASAGSSPDRAFSCARPARCVKFPSRLVS